MIHTDWGKGCNIQPFSVHNITFSATTAFISDRLRNCCICKEHPTKISNNCNRKAEEQTCLPGFFSGGGPFYKAHPFLQFQLTV